MGEQIGNNGPLTNAEKVVRAAKEWKAIFAENKQPWETLPLGIRKGVMEKIKRGERPPTLSGKPSSNEAKDDVASNEEQLINDIKIDLDESFTNKELLIPKKDTQILLPVDRPIEVFELHIKRLRGRGGYIGTAIRFRGQDGHLHLLTIETIKSHNLDNKSSEIQLINPTEQLPVMIKNEHENEYLQESTKTKTSFQGILKLKTTINHAALRIHKETTEDVTDPDIEIHTWNKLHPTNKFLTDSEIFSGIMKGSLDHNEYLLPKFPLDVTAVSRLTNVLTENFISLTDSQKEQFLLNLAKITFGKKGHTIQRDEAMLDATNKLFVQILKFTNNDLQSSKALLKKISGELENKPYSIGEILDCFYNPTIFQHKDKPYLGSPSQETKAFLNHEKKLFTLKEKYLKNNPKIRVLAFWLNAYLGNYSPELSNFDTLLKRISSENDIELKTQMMTFLKETLYSRKMPLEKYISIEKIVNQELTKTAKEEIQPLIAKKLNEIKRILELERLIEQTKGGKIEPENLVTILQRSPSLLKYITDEELQTAIDKTIDHGIAAKLIELMRNKQTQNLY